MYSPLKLQTARAFEFFYVAAQTTVPELAATIEALMARVDAARAAGGVQPVGPSVLVYSGESEPFLLEAGYPVAPGTAAVGEAKVRTVPSRPCASLLYWGSLADYHRAQTMLLEQVTAAGLKLGDDMREWCLLWEDDGLNNVILFQQSLAQ